MKEVDLTSKNGKIHYRDTTDHFENGVLRLLSMNKNDFINWIEASSEFDGNIFDRLKFGFQKFHPVPDLRLKTGVWFKEISENSDFGIGGNKDFAWLVDRNGKRVFDPPSYEENYFEGEQGIIGGYGNYKDQMGWRLEKSDRQVQELLKVCDLPLTAKTMDIGSGYGYFRKALEKAGIRDHYGLEISKHANRISKEEFGFETIEGSVDDLNEQFDLITAWDVIEHVSDPLLFLWKVKKHLKPEGIVAIKTPNLDCPELEIFGGHYHSFKREHLVYLSPNWLKKHAEENGFCLLKIQSISHLLSGFVGEETKKIAENLKGSDLVVYLSKE